MLTPPDTGETGVTGVRPNKNASLPDTPPEYSGVTRVTKRAKSLIPVEADRPKYVVLDDGVNEGSTKLRPGVWHFGIKPGRGEDAPPTLTQKWICSPLHLDAVTTDTNGSNYGRLLRIKTTLGRWMTWAMPMEMLKGDCSDLRGALLSMGVEIDPYSRELLAVYLQDRAPERRIQCTLQTGWASVEYRAFVLPDAVIGPKAGDVAYQSGSRGSEEYTMAGTLAGWQAGTSALAVGNPLLILSLCSAFAGPLLARCNGESGGIHLIGKSSSGKTTAIDAACSVWGGPNFKRSWRATSNGLEGAAALFNDSLLALDEISECDPRDVGEIVYMLGNGLGKQRSNRTGNARTVSRWKCFVLSSGERSIETTMADGGHRIKAGQSVRLLDVPAQRTYGAWDNLHQFETGAEFSDGLKRAAATQYGHAGRAFLEKLTRDHDCNFSDALEAIKALPGFQATGGEGQAKRAAGRFAMLALAGETATKYGVTGWASGASIEAAAVGFSAWLSLREAGNSNSETWQIVERVVGFIERHGDSRFSPADTPNDQHVHQVRDRAGWWRNSEGGRIYLFTADGLRESLKGFDFNRALDALQERGIIDAPGADGRRAKATRIDNRLMKLYSIHTSKANRDAP